MIELYEKKITYIIHISLDIVGGKHIWANELMIRNTVAELKLLNLPHKYFKIWFRIVRQKQVLKKFLMPFIERSVKETWTFSKFDFQGSNSKWDYWSFTLYSSLANLVILLLHSMKNEFYQFIQNESILKIIWGKVSKTIFKFYSPGENF